MTMITSTKFVGLTIVTSMLVIGSTFSLPALLAKHRLPQVVSLLVTGKGLLDVLMAQINQRLSVSPLPIMGSQLVEH